MIRATHGDDDERRYDPMLDIIENDRGATAAARAGRS
jgi:hypothetical protein